MAGIALYGPLQFSRNIGELCKSLICRHSLKNAGEVFLAVFFIGECDLDSMGVELSGRNFAKTIVKDSEVLRKWLILLGFSSKICFNSPQSFLTLSPFSLTV